MVASRFRWLAIAAAAVVFGGLLAAPYHSAERALIETPGWLTLADGWAPASRALHLGLHLMAVWLAAGLFGTLPSARASRVALLLFAIHPLHTQTLASMEARGVLVMTVAALGAIRLWTRGREGWAATCGVLATMADWSALALPALLWVWSTPEQRRTSAAPLGVMTGAGLASLLHALGAVTISFDALAWQGVGLLRWLWLAAAPIGLTADPDLRAAPAAAAAAWVVVGMAAWVLCRRRTVLRRWVVCVGLALAPVSTIIGRADVAFDSRAALALVFLCGAAGWMLHRADLRLLGAAAVLFAVVSWSEVALWQSEQSVWLRAVRVAPEKAEPRRRLAPLVEPEHAVELLERARRRAPDDAAVALDLAEALVRAGRAGYAEVEWARAQRIAGCDPNHAARINRLTPAGQAPPCVSVLAR